MNEVLDPGHEYLLLTLDGDKRQVLTFVKRCDPETPERFPGNKDAYPGTTLQSVIRCLVDRVDFLQGQVPDDRNLAVRVYLERCLWLLEDRAAERHGLDFNYRIEDMLSMPMCAHCGHVVCSQFQSISERAAQVRRLREDGHAETRELIQKALALLLEEKKASIALFQRRFGLGYMAAAGLMDLLAERGVVGPAGSSSGVTAREILASEERLRKELATYGG